MSLFLCKLFEEVSLENKIVWWAGEIGRCLGHIPVFKIF